MVAARVKRPVLAFPLRLSLLLLALSHVVGCTDESAGAPGLTFNACAPLDIGLPPGLTAEQLQGVTDAVAMWNQAASTALGSTAASEPIAGPMVPLAFQAAAPPFHGLYDNQEGRIFINQDLTDVAPLSITIAHEIGHAFGLPHV